MQIVSNGPWNIYRLPIRGGDALTCEVSPASQFVTVYRASDGRPVATLARRRVYANGPAWTAAATDGSPIGNGFPTPSRALRVIAVRAERDATRREGQRIAARVANAALWSLYRYA